MLPCYLVRHCKDISFSLWCLVLCSKGVYCILQKPPTSTPVQVKHKPGFTPMLASNANYISHKPIYSTVNSNGNTKPKSELSGPSKLQSASTNGGMPKPSLNGSGDAVMAVNSNSASCATSKLKRLFCIVTKEVDGLV